MASSETAGGRPGRAWSAPSSSCLGPCSRSLSRANTSSPRLLHVSHCVVRCLPGAPCVVRCLPNTLLTCQDVYTRSAFPKVIRNTLCARRRGSLLQPHVFTCVVRMRQQWCLLSTGSGLGTRLVCRARVVPRNVVLRNQPYESHPNLTVHVRACDVHDVWLVFLVTEAEFGWLWETAVRCAPQARAKGQPSHAD